MTTIDQVAFDAYLHHLTLCHHCAHGTHCKQGNHLEGAFERAALTRKRLMDEAERWERSEAKAHTRFLPPRSLFPRTGRKGPLGRRVYRWLRHWFTFDRGTQRRREW